MNRFLHWIPFVLPCKVPQRSLICAWFFGLAAGVGLSFLADDSFLSTMRAAASSHVSIIGLLSAILLPLLFSAFAVYISQPQLLLPVAFCKAFLFSYLAFGVTAAFGTAGWLVRGLLMFSDCLTLPLLWWFWLRCLRIPKEDATHCFFFACAAALLIGCVDYCTVSPFLANLIL